MTSFLELVNRLEALQAQGQWPAVLIEISNTVIGLLSDPRAKGLVFGSAEMDRFCLAAGALAAQQFQIQPAGQMQAGLAVHVATELYDGQGGHSLALKDVIRARPDLHHVVLVTNLHDRELPLARFAHDLGPSVQVAQAPAVPLPHKLQWLQTQLAALRPGLLTLFHHHYDVVAVAAAQPGVAGEMAYFHHADHDMALGVFLPHALHVDCTNLSHHKCQHYLGVHNPVYWPLVAPDLGARQGHTFMAGGALRTCSHGSAGKFTAPGRYGYFELIHQRLAELPGDHLHIGQLPDEVLGAVRQRLTAAGLEASRFRHQPPVPGLWAFLQQSDVDLCISSFPIQGAKGLVETEGAGIPVLMHESGMSKHHSTRELIYEDALWWDTPERFMQVLRELTPAALQAQAAAARRFYEQWHHPRELAYALSNARRTAACPPVRHPPCDTLALYLR
ncbi:hypothetical protein [Roseateles sp. BYS87W]|uniref:Uncharacterized protein n=1 Tax=Pelomonas baiyunensis TaxID=3299026 RepID=A0ABW7GXT9_9BURK